MRKKSRKAKRGGGASRPKNGNGHGNGRQANGVSSGKETSNADCVGVEHLERIKAAAAKGEAPPPRGLVNLGNTCFFNAALQNVCRMRIVRDHFVAEAAPSGEGSMTRALRDVIVNMWSLEGPGSLNPNKLFQAIGTRSPRFRGRNQQDSHEVLRALWDGLVVEEAARLARMPEPDPIELLGMSESAEGGAASDSQSSGDLQIPAPKTTSIVDRSVSGLLCSTITCQECGFVSSTNEPFFDISLPLVPESYCGETVSGATRDSVPRSTSKKSKDRQRSTGRSTAPHPTRKATDGMSSSGETNSRRSRTSLDGPSNGGLDTSSGQGISDVSGSDIHPLFDVESYSDHDESGLVSLFDEPETECDSSRQSSVELDSPKPTQTSSIKQHLARASRTLFGTRYKSLKDSLDVFTKVEVLDGENGYFCEKCNKERQKHDESASSPVPLNGQVPPEGSSSVSSEGTNSSSEANSAQEEVPARERKPVRSRATKQFLIKRYPAAMVFQMKRFSQSYLRGGLRKISGHVPFPLQLDLSEYANSNGGVTAHYIYGLTGVVVHGGSLGGGHYTAYVREGCDSDFKGGWFYCSDSQVVRAKESTVLQSEAYMLFYEKKPVTLISSNL